MPLLYANPEEKRAGWILSGSLLNSIQQHIESNNNKRETPSLEEIEDVLLAYEGLKMHYYEIGFYGEGHEKDWTYYIKSEKKLTVKEVILKLENEFLGNDGLEQHYIDNIDAISPITASEFTSCCGLTA